MKTLVKMLLSGVLLFCLLGSPAPAQAQSKAAIVNLQKVFDGYYRTRQADASLKDRASDMDKDHKSLLDDWRKLKDDYQKLLTDANDQARSADEREKGKKAAEDKLRDIKGKEDEITSFERQASTTLAEQKGRMRKGILDDIKLAIASKAKSGNYSMVIDSGAQTYVADPMGPYYTPTLLYTNNDNDLTDAVLAQLNAGAPAEFLVPDEKKDSATEKKDAVPEKKPAK